MNKKKLPHIIAVFALAVFVVLVSACQTTEQKEALERRDYLVKNGGSKMFTQPPSESETVLKEYKEYYQTKNSGNMNFLAWQPYQYFNNSTTHTLLHPIDLFYPGIAAYVLLALAKKEFPDIDINELDVRLIKQIGNTSYMMTITDKPDKNGYYYYTATNYFKFDGVVVRVKK